MLDFDHTYWPQTEFQKSDYEWIDLSDIRSTNRYCEMKSLDAIYERITKRHNRGITLIGSGNYHYVSFLLLMELAEPFTLVLFDHHTDMLISPSKSIISCGSWVMHALENLSMLKKVIIIGVEKQWEALVPIRFKEKVTILSHERIYHDPKLANLIISEITTKSVYISIDKDVLSETEVMTDWDQGNLSLKKLDELLLFIASRKKVIGEDICGEYPRSAVEFYKPEQKQIIKKNEQANQNIVKITLSAIKQD